MWLKRGHRVGRVNLGRASAWRNWAGDQTCTPAVFERPCSTSEVVDALERAANAKHTVRVAGSGHSFSEAVLTSHTLMSLAAMDRVLDVDRESGLVRVEAGIGLRALNLALDSHGLAAENLGDIDVQSLAGATATGTHGTGARLRNLSAGDRLDAAGPGRRTRGGALRTRRRRCVACRPVEHRRAGGGDRAHSGATPAFTLEGIDEPSRSRTCSTAWTSWPTPTTTSSSTTSPTPTWRSRGRTTAWTRPASPLPTSGWTDDVLLTTGPSDWPAHRSCAAVADPAHGPGRSRVRRIQPARGPVLRVFASPRLVHFTEMEYSIPRARARDAVVAVRRLIERARLRGAVPDGAALRGG